MLIMHQYYNCIAMYYTGSHSIVHLARWKLKIYLNFEINTHTIAI